jgi:uncharacterized protein (DUF2236 family)
MAIDEQSFEAGLARLRQSVSDPAAGIFGPGSPVWEIGRHTVVFLGAGRAALLQLAHPWIAQAIADHSIAREDPLRRFRRTFAHVFPMVFGSLDQAIGSARQVFRMHAAVSGRMRGDAGPFPSGSPYRALDVEAAHWVHATLIDSAVRIYELTVDRLSLAEKDAYLRESARFGVLLGIPAERMEPNWNAFVAYTERMWSSGMLDPSDAAREIAGELLHPPGRALAPFAAWYRVMTAGLLPPRIRSGFGLDFDPWRDGAVFAASLRALRAMRHLPARVRYLPPYLEAQRRLAGRPEADWLGRLFNRIVLGGADV